MHMSIILKITNKIYNFDLKNRVVGACLSPFIHKMIFKKMFTLDEKTNKLLINVIET